MRTEQEMFDLIILTANTDKRVRAAYMNGSRTNPNVEKDEYRDYDIVFVVTETESFLANKNWISVFGEAAIVQEPDSIDLGWGQEHDFSCSYTWLILLSDGNRIDLTILSIDCACENYLSDTLCIRLLDKDHILPDIPEANNSLYHIKPPSRQQYNGCCNEFWWCLNNVAKGIVRDQMPYAQRMYMQVVHVELDKMIEWYIAIQYDFEIATGMWGKYFKKYLTPEIYEQYMKTYSDCKTESFWIAIFIACDLFRDIAKKVALHFEFSYNEKDDVGMKKYLLKMRQQVK